MKIRSIFDKNNNIKVSNKINAYFKSFNFLEKEPELYSRKDLKKIFKYK